MLEFQILRWQPIQSGVTEEVMNGFDAREYPAYECSTGLSSFSEAKRVHLQHRLHILLLPVEGCPISQRETPDVGGDARGVYLSTARVTPYALSDRGLARRRADIDEG